MYIEFYTLICTYWFTYHIK